LQFPSMIGSRLTYCISRPTIASIDVAIGAAATAVTKIARRNFMVAKLGERCPRASVIHLDIVI
jgi:hypothetical protein